MSCIRYRSLTLLELILFCLIFFFFFELEFDFRKKFVVIHSWDSLAQLRELAWLGVSHLLVLTL